MVRGPEMSGLWWAGHWSLRKDVQERQSPSWDLAGKQEYTGARVPDRRTNVCKGFQELGPKACLQIK